MLRVESNTNIVGFTEFEEDILFDEDDPDFDQHSNNHHHHRIPVFLNEQNLIFATETNGRRFASINVPSKMSIASVHPVELHSSHSSLATLSHSLDDITLSGCWSTPPLHSDHVMTIEELRMQMGSCFTCGVSWTESHVSLDCSECGGYAMERPCNVCDGTCGAIFKRDLSTSHASGKARWIGECGGMDQKSSSSAFLDDSANHKALTQELTKRLEKLSANS